jgi:hypothetical protein
MNKNIKLFKVAALSSNHNSFGLRQNLLVARDGYAVSALRSIAQEQWTVGQIIGVPMLAEDGIDHIDHFGLASMSCECVNRMAKAPSKLVEHIWNLNAVEAA